MARVKENTGTPVTLPVVYNCPELDNYFPCITIPHEVWINSEGKVAGITFSNEVIPANIEVLLNGDDVHMRLKKDRFDVDDRKPLFINGNAGDGAETKYRSLITGYIDGVAGGTGVREENGSITGFYSLNQTLYSLVKTAYSREISFVDYPVILEVKEKEKFNISYADTAAYHYLYSYDLMLPPADDTVLFRYMQDDLRRYFNICVKKEKRKMKCLVLTASGSPVPRPAGKRKDFDIEEPALKKYIYNYSPAEAVKLLNNYSHIPIINETNTTSNIAIDLPYNINDIKELRRAFATIGLS